jgi:hypothetical protein
MNTENTTEPAESQQRDVIDTATAEEREALAGHLRAMADAVADGTLPLDGGSHAEITHHIDVKDFASRDAALSAFDALADRLGVEVVHSADRHLVTRVWGGSRQFGVRAEYKAILWEDRAALVAKARAEEAAPADTAPVEDRQAEVAETEHGFAESTADVDRRLARVSNAVGGLVRLREGGYLKNLRAGEHIDAITAALDGYASPSALVEVDDDTVYVSDGVVTSTFSISEAYTVLHALVEALPNARRSLGLEVGA